MSVAGQGSYPTLRPAHPTPTRIAAVAEHLLGPHLSPCGSASDLSIVGAQQKRETLGFTPRGQVSEIDPIKLMVWHLEALYTRDDRGRIIAVNERNGGPAPRLFLGRTRDGDVWSVRQDQPEWLRTAVAGMLGGSDPVEHGCPGSERLAELEKLLGRAGRVERKWTGPAFLVPDQVEGDGAVVRIESDNCYLLDPLLSAWIPDVAAGVPMSASIVEGRAVSLCCSARITPEAHEAGLETHPDFRGLGHAGLVTVGWSRAVRELGAIPLYSTSVENMASLRVAEKLGLEQFGTDFHLT